MPCHGIDHTKIRSQSCSYFKLVANLLLNSPDLQTNDIVWDVINGGTRRLRSVPTHNLRYLEDTAKRINSARMSKTNFDRKPGCICRHIQVATSVSLPTRVRQPVRQRRVMNCAAELVYYRICGL